MQPVQLDSIQDADDHPDGWSLLGSNGHARADRLKELGWNPKWSKQQPLREVVREMLEVGLTAQSV